MAVAEGKIDRATAEGFDWPGAHGWAWWCARCGHGRYGYRSDESAAKGLDRHLERCDA